jgi:hypothetical protein
LLAQAETAYGVRPPRERRQQPKLGAVSIEPSMVQAASSVKTAINPK